MDTSSELAHAPTQHVYRVRSGLRVGLAFGLLLICTSFVLLFINAVTGLSAADSTGKAIGGIISIILLAAILVAFIVGYIGLLRMRIVISPAGVAYSTLAYHLFAPWEQVAGVRDRVDGRGRQTKVLELRQPAEEFESNWLLGIVRLWAASPDSAISLQLFLTQGKGQASGLLEDISKHILPPAASQKRKGKGRK